ncbi:MAG: hypothetical protein AAB074_16410 [Planctomycetota bacterium]
MIFLKRQFPLAICFVVGIAMALQYYVPSTWSQKLGSQMSDWYIVISIFAAFLGFGSVAHLHYRKVSLKAHGWGYSALVFVGLVLMLIVGFASGGKQSTERLPDEQGENGTPEVTKGPDGKPTKQIERVFRPIPDQEEETDEMELAITTPPVPLPPEKDPKKFKVLEVEIDYAADGKVTKAVERKYDRKGNVLATREREIDKDGALVPYEGTPTSFEWVFRNVLFPLQSTMFALLGFYIASAAFRSFRAKSFEAGLLLVTALIVLIGNVPFTNHLWAEGLGIHHAHGIRMEMPDIVAWLMGTPNTAARRGVGFGVALGIIATSLKIIFGIERGYLGGGD